MPIFGQVWLWSSLAFLVGAALCWSLVALPARRRVSELEAELTARARRQPQKGEFRRPPEDDRDDREAFEARRPVTGADREPERSEPEKGPLTRAYALAGTGPRTGSVTAPPEIDTELSDGTRSSATQYLNVTGSSTLEAPPEVQQGKQDLGWFDDDEGREQDSPSATTVLPPVPAEPADPRLVDDVDGLQDNGGTVFTQHTHPIPGELIRQLDEAGKSPAHALVDDIQDGGLDGGRDGGRDDVEDLEHGNEYRTEQAHAETDTDGDSKITEGDDERGILAELDGSGESKHQLVEDPEVTSVMTPTVESSESVHGGRDRAEVAPANTAETQGKAVSASRRRRAVSDQSTQGVEEPKIMPGVTVQAEPTKNTLPKRVPSKPPRRTPFGVQTTSPATPVAATGTTTATSDPAAADSVNEAPRALFEPIVPAGEGAATPPPPHRLRGANGRGPFGPGSAMPGPDGAAPSPEYTVKASASAMRYCTHDSDNYERTVAEVWFRSAADAERVGFRPLG